MAVDVLIQQYRQLSRLSSHRSSICIGTSSALDENQSVRAQSKTGTGTLFHAREVTTGNAQSVTSVQLMGTILSMRLYVAETRTSNYKQVEQCSQFLNQDFA